MASAFLYLAFVYYNVFKILIIKEIIERMMYLCLIHLTNCYETERSMDKKR